MGKYNKIPKNKLVNVIWEVLWHIIYILSVSVAETGDFCVAVHFSMVCAQTPSGSDADGCGHT